MRLVTEDVPSALGSPGLAQGAYGSAGNLELVLPSAGGSVRVQWYNADPADPDPASRVGAAPRSWSKPLVLHLGAEVSTARISQFRSGPNYLELLTVVDAALRRHYWTPE